jgi:hypothetical protein
MTPPHDSLPALSADDILAIDDIITERVPVPQWKGSVLVRGMTGRERDEFEATILERRGRRMLPNTANIRARVAAWCCVTEDGDRMFPHPDMVDKLGSKSAAALDIIYEVAARLSGLEDKDIEEMAEALKTNPFGAGSSDSPANSTAPPQSSDAGSPPASSPSSTPTAS